ncbi:MAG: carboxypeptidase regulatory-like domain-containing protein [Ignavibacteriales bacterium]|nr:carboxypeptidase regulatory-like domain-containing protein [Ignavibacteriales bacterium]
MHQRYVVTILFVFLALVVCLTSIQAQIMPPVLAPTIMLKAALSDGGKVQMAWELTRDTATVKYYYIYRASMPITQSAIPDSSRFTRIDSVTKREYTDLPPRPTTAAIGISYVYYVTGTTTKGAVLKSNLVVVVVLPPPVAKDYVRITSTPVESGEINIPYKYQVKAVSSDSSAKLTYSLNTKPNGMTIDSTGLIKWTPTERGFQVVEVAVKSNKGGSATQRFAIRVASGSGIVLGTVTDPTGAKPIGQVVVRLLKAGLQSDFTTSFDYKAVTDATGKYKFDGVDPGSYYVRAEPMNGDYLAEWYDGASSQRDAKTIVVSNNASTVVNFTLQSRYKPVYYTVKGSVVDATNHTQLRYASVYFVLAGFALNGSRGFAADPTLAQDFRGMFDFNQSLDHRLDGTCVQFVFKALTDTNGEFKLTLPQGSFIAYAEAKGHNKIFYNDKTNLLLADTIRVVDRNLEGIKFNLPPLPVAVLGEINGTITDSATGRGVRSRVIAFRELWVTPMVLAPSPGSYVPGVYVGDTDSLGKYSIPNLQPGKYLVLAMPMGSYAPAYYSTSGSTQNWSKASRVAVNGNVVAGIDITVKPLAKPMVGYTFVKGTVSTNSGAGKLGKTSGLVGVAGAIVYAANADGTIYGYDVTDESGSYAIAGAAPGSYTLFVDAPGFSSSSSMAASPTYAADAKGTAMGASGINFSLTNVVTSVEENLPLVPTGYVLEQNYPNPFNPTTQILFSLPNSERVTLTIYNLIGQKIAELVNEVMSAGSHVVTWNGRDSRGMQLPSGVYFYRLESPGFTAARRMLMLK